MELPDKIQRFKFCSSHQDKVESFWKEQVSFCDEQIFAFDEEAKLICRKGPFHQTKRMQNIPLLFSWLFQDQDIISLLKLRVDTRYGSDQFLSLMKKHIAKQAVNISQQPYVMDQFPVHFCAAAKSWFTSRKGDILLLPPNSPDLMPIAKLTELIVKRINCKRTDSNNCSLLWERVHESFNDSSFKMEIKSLLYMIILVR